MLGFGFDMSHFDLMANDDGVHSLLEPPSPAYSSVTVRRAFIVWLHCGQQNEFKDVCNYYHRLECLEENLPKAMRASSRLQEFKLLTEMPPYTYFFNRMFPNLYLPSKIDAIDLKKVEEMKFEDCVFNLEGFHDMKAQKGVTSKDIIKTSQVIRKYCIAHSKSLRRFLMEFQDFAKKSHMANSINNVIVYINKKNIIDEIETWKRLPRHFSFLDVEVSKEELHTNTQMIKTANQSPLYSIEKKPLVHKENNIRILINDARRKELINIIPHFPDLSIKEEKNNVKTLC